MASNANVKVPKFALHLEDSTLEAHARSYPESMRENFLWLGVYLREKHARNLDSLEATIQDLGYKTTGGTISKIIIGRWSKDSEGKDTAPIMSINNFNQVVDALRNHDRVAEMAGKVPFVETGTWEDIRDYIDIRRAPDQVCKFGLVIGPTGSQKTESFKHYVLENNHGSCKHMESPDTATMSKFYTDMGELFGASAHSSSPVKRARIRENVNAFKTLIIDNIQRLYKPNEGWNQPIFNFLQKLQDDKRCTIILGCVPQFQETLRAGRTKGYFEQFVGRCGGPDEFLVLPDYTPREDLLRIAAAFKLQDPEKHIGILERLSKVEGRVRVLFNYLQKAKRRAEDDGSKTLRIGHLRTVLETTSLAGLIKGD
jgi:hypothetical protein